MLLGLGFLSQGLLGGTKSKTLPRQASAEKLHAFLLAGREGRLPAQGGALGGARPVSIESEGAGGRGHHSPHGSLVLCEQGAPPLDGPAL